MKKRLLRLLPKLIQKLEELYDSLKDKILDDLDYSSLSPIDSGDKTGHYSKALTWALDNRKKEDIKNIALTGTYGSGKSTILKTFQKQYKGTSLKFLNISLATFKEEKVQYDENNNKIEKNKDELLRLIETSILQQIFYHEEDKNIPDSRFKKIKSFSPGKRVLIALGLLLFGTSILNYFHPYFIQSIFKHNPFNDFICNVLHYGGITIMFFGFLFIIYKSIRIISSLTISKLKFQNAEIGIGDSLNKSVLNHHLDEILYFFSIRPYNVVVIEDLDRFQETEIFTKLREINFLLNSSKKTKEKDIVFIYAVRDDMFSDNERIKFFDFIIPVIPVINSSNSSQVLLTKKKKFNYELTDDFIEDISFFIDDMRLLHNITNEFYLYKQKQGETPLNQDKLFAIITYKNIYPNDFVKLSKNEGVLYNIINSKSEYIKEELYKIENQILEYENYIESLNELNIKNNNELRQLYVIRVLEKSSDFLSFNVNGNNISMDELLENENFDYLKEDKLKYSKKTFRSYNVGSQVLPVNIKFNEIEKIVDPTKTYDEKEQEIFDLKDGKITSLKNKVKELNSQKTKVRNLKISLLLKSNPDFDLKIDKNFDKDFIKILIRNGYVSEDYLDYISLFHEGSITRSDYKFVISIKNQQKLEFNYRLSKLDKLISKINLSDFNTDFILNYDLLNFLLINDAIYKSQVEQIFNKLKDESEISLEFIEGFIGYTENLDLFFNKLTHYWDNIWNHYANSSVYSSGEKYEILNYIIKYGDITSIKNIAEKSNLKKNILQDLGFLYIIDQPKKIIAIIEELDLNFIDLNFKDSPDELLEFIFENYYYQFNAKIITALIKKFGEFKQVDFDNSNYSAILKSKCTSLIKNVKTNINEYVENLYLKIDTNINEEEESLIELFNDQELAIDNKKLIIEKVNTKISDISKIINKSLHTELIEQNQIESNWFNLLTHFHNSEETISESTITFINDKENSKLLSKNKMPLKVDEKNIFGKFCKSLVQINSIENEPFDLVTKSVPWWYKDLDIAILDEEKVKSLIKNNVISPEIQSFNSLKSNFEFLHIKLLEKHKEKFIKLIDSIVIDSKDLESILKSSVLNNDEKSKFVDNCTDEVVTSNIHIIKLLSDILLQAKAFGIRETLIRSVILNDEVSYTNRIKLFNKYPSVLELVDIDDFLINLSNGYEKITYKNKRAKISDNDYNRSLLNNLKSKNYISSYSSGFLYGLRVNHKRT